MTNIQLGLRPFSPLPISHSMLYSNHSWKIVEFAFIFPPLLLRLFLSTAHLFILAKIANSVATPFLLLLPSLLIGHSLLLLLLPSSHSNASIIAPHFATFDNVFAKTRKTCDQSGRGMVGFIPLKIGLIRLTLSSLRCPLTSDPSIPFYWHFPPKWIDSVDWSPIGSGSRTRWPGRSLQSSPALSFCWSVWMSPATDRSVPDSLADRHFRQHPGRAGRWGPADYRLGLGHGPRLWRVHVRPNFGSEHSFWPSFSLSAPPSLSLPFLRRTSEPGHFFGRNGPWLHLAPPVCTLSSGSIVWRFPGQCICLSGPFRWFKIGQISVFDFVFLSDNCQQIRSMDSGQLIFGKSLNKVSYDQSKLNLHSFCYETKAYLIIVEPQSTGKTGKYDNTRVWISGVLW